MVTVWSKLYYGGLIGRQCKTAVVNNIYKTSQFVFQERVNCGGLLNETIHLLTLMLETGQ